MIEAQGLVKQFDDLVAVNAIDLNVGAGEVLALLGPNGAGKTTTVRMLSAVLKPTAGRARVVGFDTVKDAQEVRRNVGVLTESPGNYTRMTGREYLNFFGQLRGMSPMQRRVRIAYLTERFQMEFALDRRLGEYSKGMAQKIALVRTLLHNPPVLLLDEPTSAMDPQSARLVRDAILQMRSDEKRTIIICTHNLPEAEELADCIAIIRRGQIIVQGTATELKRRLLGTPLMEIQLLEPPHNGILPLIERVATVVEVNARRVRYLTQTPEATNPELLRLLAAAHVSVVTLSEVSQSLESVYLRVIEEGVQPMETHPKSSTWIERLWENISPILTITQREIVDTLRDWRLMFPIVVLVTLFPLLANFAADQGVKFINEYGGNLIAVRLFPFLMLVVGFFPSSFSLVIALESFVGEKERRSLEPLLAAPLTDLQLYLGKLLAATIPPVVGGYFGMLVYVVMLGLSNGWWPTPELMIVSFVLSTSEALVMVTAAVIISSQSTSVRAANLLSSFIIIPMSFLLQGEAGLLLFANYTGLWWIAIFLLTVNVMLIRLGVRLFDREHLLGRDLDMIDLVGAIQTFWDAFWPRAGARALFTRDIPRQLREIRIELMLTAVVVTIGGLCVGLWGAQNYALPLTALNFQGKITAEAIRKAVEQSGWLHSLGVWPIFFNNVRSLVGAALIGVFSFGVLALLLLMAPLAVIAYVMLQVGQVGINPWVFFGVFVLPHGILELPAALIATAQVLRMGAIVLRPPEEGGGIMGMIRETGQFCRLFICIVAPLLLIAAWLESAITPWLVELAFG